MPENWIDPASLQGDALRRWYMRSPADLERERQEAEARRYNQFFHGGSDDDLHPELRLDVSEIPQVVDAGVTLPTSLFPVAIDRGFATVPVDPKVRAATGARSASPSVPATSLLPFAPTSGRSSPTPPSNWFPGSAAAPYSDVRQVGEASAAPPSQRAPIDPSKTPVFQTGPDGKLHPIPGWHTTGPFDFKEWSHNIHWGGVAQDLAKIGIGVAGFFSGAAMFEGLLPALGPEAESAVADGIAENAAAKAASRAAHDHHPHPKYMGGAEKQELERLTADLHKEFHSMLAKAQREAGFPPVGGKTGSKDVWRKFFELNPRKREEAMDILRRVSREFDEAHGTKISPRLASPSNAAGTGTPPAK